MPRPSHRFRPGLLLVPLRTNNPKSQNDISTGRLHPASRARTPRSSPELSPRSPSLPAAPVARLPKVSRRSPAFHRVWTTRLLAARFLAGSAARARCGSPRLPRPRSAAPDTRVAPSPFHVSPFWHKLDSGRYIIPFGVQDRPRKESAAVTKCPECDAELDLDEDEVEEGEILSCPECDVELEVTQTHPVHLIVISEDEDEEEEEEDDEEASVVKEDEKEEEEEEIE